MSAIAPSVIVTLFFLPFLHEDVAIVSASYFITQEGFPIGAAYLCLYLGIVVSDVLIYLLGRGARRFAWARRLLICERVNAIRQKLNDNLVFSVAIVRVMPGLLAPTFLACGWFGLSFRVFLLTTMMAAALYLALMLSLMLLFGETLLPILGHWGWLLVLALVLLKTLLGRRRGRQTGEEEDPPGDAVALYSEGLFAGLPRLSPQQRQVSLAERLPSWLFYLPMLLSWLFHALQYRSLTLPTAANPRMRAGGLWGESKSELMSHLRAQHRAWLADYLTLAMPEEEGERQAAYESLFAGMARQGFDYPLVVKPDVGWQGYGVCRVESHAELQRYLDNFPGGQMLIVQEMLPWAGEAGIYYIRMPGEPRGRVVSMTFRYFPHVVGDGHSTVRQLIGQGRRSRFKALFYLGRHARHRGVEEALLKRVPQAGEVVRLSFIGSIRTGGHYQDATAYITEPLQARIEQIAQAIPEFYFGRFDVRFLNLPALQQGEGFKLIEINGAGSEPIHVWDPRTPMLHAYTELMRYQSMLFKVAAENRRRGVRPMGVLALLRLTRNYSKILKRYPASS